MILATFVAGVVVGLVFAASVASYAKRQATAEFLRERSERSGLQPMPDESFEAFCKRSARSVAEREFEQEHGLPRKDGESFDDYLQRLAVVDVQRERATNKP